MRTILISFYRWLNDSTRKTLANLIWKQVDSLHARNVRYAETARSFQEFADKVKAESEAFHEKTQVKINDLLNEAQNL